MGCFKKMIVLCSIIVLIKIMISSFFCRQICSIVGYILLTKESDVDMYRVFQQND